MSFKMYNQEFKNNAEFNKTSSEFKKDILSIFGGRTGAKKIFKESVGSTTNWFTVFFWYRSPISNTKKSFTISRSYFVKTFNSTITADIFYDIRFHHESSAFGGEAHDICFNAVSKQDLKPIIQAVTKINLES